MVTIGDQCWFQENLRSAHYANGDSIPFVSDETEWNEINTGAYTFYDLDSEMAEVYGFLYNWETTADERKVVHQDGRLDHIPIGINYHQAPTMLWVKCRTCGGALKEAGTLHWDSPNFGANNLTGFTALPGGERGYGTAGYSGLGTKAQFWSAESNNGGARSYRLNHDDAELNSQTIGKSRGLPFGVSAKRRVSAAPIPTISNMTPANVDDGSCATPSFYGCMDAGFAEYDPQANVDDGSCLTLVGCSDSDVLTYGGVDYELVGIVSSVGSETTSGLWSTVMEHRFRMC